MELRVSVWVRVTSCVPVKNWLPLPLWDIVGAWLGNWVTLADRLCDADAVSDEVTACVLVWVTLAECVCESVGSWLIVEVGDCVCEPDIDWLIVEVDEADTVCDSVCVKLALGVWENV